MIVPLLLWTLLTAEAFPAPEQFVCPDSQRPEGVRREVARTAQGTWVWCEALGIDGETFFQGPYVGWYANGQVASYTEYRIGRRHGKHLRWHPNGLQAVRGTFQNDQPHGLWQVWDEQGRLRRRATFARGKLQGKWHHFPNTALPTAP